MALIAYTNTKKHTVHIGGKSIKSGATREVEETLAPGYKAKTTERAEVENPLQTVLDGNVKSILAALPDLSDDDINALESMESETENPRKGVLNGLLEETLRRADLGAAE